VWLRSINSKEIKIVPIAEMYEKELNNQEISWIAHWRLIYPDLLNVTKGGEGACGNIPWNKNKHGYMSKEQRRKIGESNKERIVSQETRNKLSVKGLQQSKDTKSKISASNIIAQNNPELLELRRKRMIGNKFNVGHKPSELTKAILSRRFSGEKNPMYGQKHTAEELDKMRKASTGKATSEETKEKLRKKSLNKKYPNRKRLSGEIKKQWLEKVKAYWDKRKYVQIDNSLITTCRK
jgi:hypothetical protein